MHIYLIVMQNDTEDHVLVLANDEDDLRRKVCAETSVNFHIVRKITFGRSFGGFLLNEDIEIA